MKVSTYIIVLLVACGIGGVGLVLGVSHFNSKVETAQNEASEFALTKQDFSRFTDSFGTWMIQTDQILAGDANLLIRERKVRGLIDSQLVRMKRSKLGRKERLPLSEIEQFVNFHKIRLNRVTTLTGDNRKIQLRTMLDECDRASEDIMVTLDLLDSRLGSYISDARSRHAAAMEIRTIASWVMVVLFLALIGVAWKWTARTISAPLRKLSREAKAATSNGNLIQQVRVAPQEIVNLSRSFSDLVGKMDGQVRKRTAHLAKANKELDKARVQAEAASDAKSEFLTNVSHELRTPLSSIRASADILYQFPEEEKDVRMEFAEIILLDAERLTRLIDNVLDLGKIQSGCHEWKREPVEIADTLFEVVRACSVESQANGVTVDLDVRGRLPVFHGDRDRLKQLWTNLIGNAVKFSDMGDEVTVSARLEDGVLVVAVEDSGPGIGPVDREAIFDRFQQVSTDTLTAKPNGTGLGLTIAKEIVDRHGGQIAVESEVG
ncbi:MAG: HAMP domain-containing sensor histidine kinase, partial [Planctomycetota bacterium]|nr:HAMP domain-containing sensor histidine kinase [Planctomycetota bacterium]